MTTEGGECKLIVMGKNGRGGLGKEGIWKWGCMHMFRCVSKSLPLPSIPPPPGHLKNVFNFLPVSLKTFSNSQGGGGGIWEGELHVTRYTCKEALGESHHSKPNI